MQHTVPPPQPAALQAEQSDCVHPPAHPTLPQHTPPAGALLGQDAGGGGGGGGGGGTFVPVPVDVPVVLVAAPPSP